MTMVSIGCTHCSDQSSLVGRWDRCVVVVVRYCDVGLGGGGGGGTELVVAHHRFPHRRRRRSVASRM
jgi:hypothetical protein